MKIKLAIELAFLLLIVIVVMKAPTGTPEMYKTIPCVYSGRTVLMCSFAQPCEYRCLPNKIEEYQCK